MRRVVTLLSLCVAVGVCAALLWSCGDPVHDAQVEALGPEASNVSPGPLHRAGQPCLTCHGGRGPADLELSVAGTVFQTRAADSLPLLAGTVTIYDATQLVEGGAPRSAVTNAAGNFYIEASRWSPTYPLHDISVTIEGLAQPTSMHTAVGRDGSCAACHYLPEGRTSHGRVYLVADPADLPGARQP